MYIVLVLIFILLFLYIYSLPHFFLGKFPIRKQYLFYMSFYVCMLPICMPIYHLYFWYLWRREVDVIFPATGSKGGCELMWMLGIKSGSPRNVTSALNFLLSVSLVWSCLCLTLLLVFLYYSFLRQVLRWPRLTLMALSVLKLLIFLLCLKKVLGWQVCTTTTAVTCVVGKENAGQTLQQLCELNPKPLCGASIAIFDFPVWFIYYTIGFWQSEIVTIVCPYLKMLTHCACNFYPKSLF